jgi:hypothetical protein
MSLITEKSFEYSPPSWVTDPAIDPADKRYLAEEMGMGDESADCDAMYLDSKCFNCGEVLSSPYIYWHGEDKGISLHPKCAVNLAKGILRDVEEARGKESPLSGIKNNQ